MSLADELQAERPRPPSPTERWITNWYASLDDADKATFDEWVADPGKSGRQLWRVLKARGFPHARSSLCEWVSKQRDAS